MSTERRIVVVSAGLSNPSSTALLAGRLASAARVAFEASEEGALQVDTVELRPLAHDLANQLLSGFAVGELARAQQLVADADALIVVTPVFSASYSGLFKTFFDVLEEGVLRDKPVLIAATAGTARHSLVLDHALRPLFSYLKAVVLPTGVFAASEDWGSHGDRDGALASRIGRAAGELVSAVRALPPRAATDATGLPELEEFVDFGTLLAG